MLKISKMPDGLAVFMIPQRRLLAAMRVDCAEPSVAVLPLLAPQPIRPDWHSYNLGMPDAMGTDLTRSSGRSATFCECIFSICHCGSSRWEIGVNVLAKSCTSVKFLAIAVYFGKHI